MTRLEYIQHFKKSVISVTKGTKLFPSVMMAQAILESSDGNSELAKKYNNHFGIKADSSWNGDVINMNTGEYLQGQYVTIKDGFRVYDDPKDSFDDRVTFLQENPRYEKAGVFSASTPKEQVQALQNAGYSTSPNYASTLLSIMTKYNLFSLDELQEKMIRNRRYLILVIFIFFLISSGLYFYLVNK